MIERFSPPINKRKDWVCFEDDYFPCRIKEYDKKERQ
jgi:hypothetical protein